jgi:hypothetical protein
MHAILKTYDAFMQQCLMIMHNDAYDHILVAFIIKDVTLVVTTV